MNFQEYGVQRCRSPVICVSVHGMVSPLRHDCALSRNVSTRTCSCPILQLVMQALALWQAITGESGQALRSPHAIAFCKRLDWHHILGWPSHQPPPVNYDEYIKLKLQHPDKLIGHRTSSSQPYWFVGVDAVIVSELMESKGEAVSLACAPLREMAWGLFCF